MTEIPATMRHFFVLTVTLLMLSTSAYAQLHIGVGAEWNASILSDSESITGPTAGLNFHWRLSAESPVFLHGGLNYSILTNNRDTGGAYTKYETKFQALSVPVIVGYEMCEDKLRVGLGVETAHILSQILSFAYESSDLVSGSYSRTYEITRYNPSRSGFLVNVEYLVLPSLGLKAAYRQGLPSSDTCYVADSSAYISHHNYVQLGLTFYFL